MRHIYCAGPYTGDEEANVLRMLAVATELRDAGFAPFVPLLSHYWEQHHPAHYEVWVALDLAWIGRCDALLRMPGESKGATREEAHAKALGIPVLRSVEEVKRWAGGPVVRLTVDGKKARAQSTRHRARGRVA